MQTEVEVAELATTVEKLGTWQESVLIVEEISSEATVDLLPMMRLQQSILYQPSVSMRGLHLLGDFHR